MANAVVGRRPWAAAIISLLLGPFIGMLYLSKGRWALIYFVVGALFAIACIAYLPALIVSPHPQLLLWLAGLPISVVGAIQSFFFARKYDSGRSQRWYSRWYVVLAVLVLPTLLALSIRTFLFQPFDIPAVSMSPSLNKGDYFFVSKFAYDNHGPDRGDLIVFHMSKYGNDYVKRVIGLPGDRIQIRGGIVIINGKEVARKRAGDFMGFCPENLCPASQYEEVLPEKRHVMVLDLYPDGPFDNTGVFVVPSGQYFVLGDNRDNSDDSRGSLGFIPAREVVGKVVLKFLANGRLSWQPVD